MAVNLESYELEKLQFVKGEEVTLASLRGKKAAVVEMWATWCPPCRDSIPHLSELQAKFADVVFVGITNEKAAAVKPFVEKMGAKMDYRVALDTTGHTSQLYMRAVGAQGIPTAFVISKAGRIVWNGHPMDPGFEAAVAQAQAEKGAADVIAVPQTQEELMSLKASALRQILDQHNILANDCFEKSDLVTKILEKIVNKA